MVSCHLYLQTPHMIMTIIIIIIVTTTTTPPPPPPPPTTTTTTTTRNQYASPPRSNAIPAGPFAQQRYTPLSDFY